MYLEPWSPRSNKPVDQVLSEAADVLDERGFTKREVQRYPSGPVCLRGAIDVAAYGYASGMEYTPAESELMKQVWNPLYASVPNYNDVPWRTKRGVQRKLRRAAKVARRRREAKERAQRMNEMVHEAVQKAHKRAEELRKADREREVQEMAVRLEKRSQELDEREQRIAWKEADLDLA